MAVRLVMQNNVDIYQFPQAMGVFPQKGVEYTIGDLHSNFTKAMHFLRTHNNVDLTKNDFDRLAQIYTTPTTRELIAEFKTIMARVVINPQARESLLRFIGDELADRGQNDLWILLLLKKLKDSGANFEILLSNHGYEFVQSYEKSNFSHSMLHQGNHAPSLENFNQLIEDEIISLAEVYSLINEAYKPSLKLISYNLNADNTEITLFSHAGIGIDTIRHLTNKYGIRFDYSNAFSLAQTIERVNDFIKPHIDANTVHTLCELSALNAGYSGGIIDPAQNPVEFILWNRNYYNLERPSTHKGYKINYVHGHDKNDLSRDNIYNLDNDLGKFIYLVRDKNYNEGEYQMLLSEGVHQLTQNNNLRHGQLLREQIQPLAPRSVQPQVVTDDLHTKKYDQLMDQGLKTKIISLVSESFGFQVDSEIASEYWNDISSNQRRGVIQQYRNTLAQQSRLNNIQNQMVKREEPMNSVLQKNAPQPIIFSDTTKYQDLPVEMRQFLSTETKQTRMTVYKGVDTEQFWDNKLRTAGRKNLVRLFKTGPQ